MSEPIVKEGGVCPQCREGKLHYPCAENCPCHINPPCGSCMAVVLTCDQCWWEEGDEVGP